MSSLLSLDDYDWRSLNYSFTINNMCDTGSPTSIHAFFEPMDIDLVAWS